MAVALLVFVFLFVVVLFLVVMLLFFVVMFLFFMRMDMRTERDAEIVLDLACRKADESAIADERKSETAAVGLGIGISYEAIGVFQFLFFVSVLVFVVMFVFVVVIFFVMMFFEVFVNEFLKRFDGFLVDGVAADLNFVVAAPERVEMESHVARRAVDPDQGIVLGTYGVVALLYDESRLFRQALGNPVVDDIDDAADGAAAIKQGRGAANDFQSFCQRRADSDGMVGADARRIGNTDSILQDFHAVPGLTANNGMPHSGSERGICDADFVLERIPEAVADFFPQRLAGQYAHWHCRVRLRFLERRGYHDFHDLIFNVVGFFLRERAAGIADGQRQTDGG